MFPQQMRKCVRNVLNYIQSRASLPRCLLELALIATKTWPLPKIIIIHHCLPKGRLTRGRAAHSKQENAEGGNWSCVVISGDFTCMMSCNESMWKERRFNCWLPTQTSQAPVSAGKNSGEVMSRDRKASRLLLLWCSVTLSARVHSRENVTLTQIGVDVLHCSNIFFPLSLSLLIPLLTSYYASLGSDSCI